MNKYIATSVLSLGLAMAAHAFTGTPVFITGATSIRAEVWGALTNNIGKPAAPDLWTVGGPTANSFTIQGTWTNNSVTPKTTTAVIVYCGFSGSATGIGTLTGDPNVAAPPYINMDGTAYKIGSPPAAPKYADLALSDVTASSTKYANASGLHNTLPHGYKGVAVVPFVFCTSPDAPARLVNMTADNFKQFAALGYQSLDQFTGNPADIGNINTGVNIVNLTGRNDGSGTRITVLADTGYGINNLIQQYFVTGVPYATLQASGPTAFGLGVDNNGDGWSSGSSVFRDLTNKVADTSCIMVGYVGIADATTDGGTPPVPLRQLTYNGAAYSQAAVESGEYTLWTYEQFYDAATTGFPVTTFKPAFAGQLEAWFDLSSDTIAINPANMNVLRSGDGGLVQHQ